MVWYLSHQQTSTQALIWLVLYNSITKILFFDIFLNTDVVVDKFREHDNLFLEKLCFDYAADLSREAVLSPCSLVLALIYLERLSQKNPNFVSSIPSSKLFLISVVELKYFIEISIS